MARCFNVPTSYNKAFSQLLKMFLGLRLSSVHTQLLIAVVPLIAIPLYTGNDFGLTAAQIPEELEQEYFKNKQKSENFSISSNIEPFNTSDIVSRDWESSVALRHSSDQFVLNNCPQLASTDLPQPYSQALCLASVQPSPESYYELIEMQINYGWLERAESWLDKAVTEFPSTRAANNIYKAVVLTEKDSPQQGFELFERVSMSDDELSVEIRNYILTAMGELQDEAELSAYQSSPLVWNNLLIGQYCQYSPELERNTNQPTDPCPINISTTPNEPSAEGRSKLLEMMNSHNSNSTRDPYLLNTLGFLSLQLEDYYNARRYYERLADQLEYVDQDSPVPLKRLKASADQYLANYDLNYQEFSEKKEYLDLLKARQEQVTLFSSINVVREYLQVIERPRRACRNFFCRIIPGADEVLETVISIDQVNRVRSERNDLLDLMRQNFTQDIIYVTPRPTLDAREMLQVVN